MAYYVMTTTGRTPPRYLHSTLESAVTEAKRLNSVLGCRAMILEVVGEVKTVERPVVEKVQECNLFFTNKSEEEDLPF